jgi:hypothetical protein
MMRTALQKRIKGVEVADARRGHRHLRRQRYRNGNLLAHGSVRLLARPTTWL